MKRSGFIIACLAWLVAGCTNSLNFKPQTTVSLFTAEFRDFTVRLRPKDDGTIELPPNARCTKGSGNNDGCVNFPAGSYGVIKFSVGSPGHDDKSCGDPGVKWVITKLQIADSGNTDTGKSTDFDQPVDAATKSALYPFKDAGKGTIYEEPWDKGSTTVQVLNRNDNPSNTTKELWYYLQASRCAAPHITAKTDPRIENDGR